MLRTHRFPASDSLMMYHVYYGLRPGLKEALDVVGISLLLSLVGLHRMELYKMDLPRDMSRHTMTHVSKELIVQNQIGYLRGYSPINATYESITSHA